MSRPWIRLYRNALNNPKVGRLTLEERGFWVSLLMLSDDAGSLPNVDDMAWSIRVTNSDAERLIESLCSHGLVTRDGHGMSLHDFDEHQFQSDTDPTAAERKRRQRAREKSQSSAVTRDHRDSHADVTRTDTDTDKNISKEVRVEAREQVRDAPQPDPVPVSKASSKTVKGSRWPADAVVPDDWLEAGADARASAGMAEIDLRAEAMKFANYWASKSGGSATKVDWRRTWINWCLTARGIGNGKPSLNGKSGRSIFAEIGDELAAREAGGGIGGLAEAD